jgi:hypothetical protein
MVQYKGKGCNVIVICMVQFLEARAGIYSFRCNSFCHLVQIDFSSVAIIIFSIFL